MGTTCIVSEVTKSTIVMSTCTCTLITYCFQDILCFSGGGILCIKASNYPAHKHRQLNEKVCGSLHTCTILYSKEPGYEVVARYDPLL